MTTIPADCPLVIGLGCSTSATPDEVTGLILAALAEAERDAADIVALATHRRKRGSRALIEAASHFGVPIHYLADEELAEGVPGTCEAVAAAAGPLLLGKRKSRYATCAVAECRAAFDLSRFGQSPSAKASMASSTLATSLAGP